jgi:general secretion pathway protein D
MVLSRIRALGSVLCAGALLLGCTAQRAYQEGNALVAQEQVTAGLVKYREAVAADPGNAVYRAALLRARDASATRLVEQGERELAAGRVDAARTAWLQALEVDPANERGRAGLRQIEADRRHSALFDGARADLEKKDVEAARLKLAAILTERPGHEGARLMLAELDEKRPCRPPRRLWQQASANRSASSSAKRPCARSSRSSRAIPA